ncbi:MAG TPA: alternative ribosome rescue aminoacyl-tRNA hydrolase ArfB [Thermoanaerobaculia bacterium]|nr:alternative ribosome rescue aminoacyl-tRNA hydrolase ArfB [Thermoanaerobaculia bacterium]
MVEINPSLSLPDGELELRTSRSAGPGGQNVNKLETRVTVRFDVTGSPSLTDDQRRRIQERLGTRISKAGVLQVSSQRHRTQAANREAAVARLAGLLAVALEPEAERKPTRMPKAAKRRRLEEKRRRGRLKQERSGAQNQNLNPM